VGQIAVIVDVQMQRTDSQDVPSSTSIKSRSSRVKKIILEVTEAMELDIQNI
jgi:hypothetical protein